MVAAAPNRNFQSQRYGIRERQLHLAVIATRTQDAQIGNHPVPWTNDGHRLLGREEAILIERFEGGQLAALAEEALQILLGDMAMPSGNVDHQLGRAHPAIRRWVPV